MLPSGPALHCSHQVLQEREGIVSAGGRLEVNWEVKKQE